MANRLTLTGDSLRLLRLAKDPQMMSWLCWKYLKWCHGNALLRWYGRKDYGPMATNIYGGHPPISVEKTLNSSVEGVREGRKGETMSESQPLNNGSAGTSASDQNQAGDGDDIGEQLRQSPVYQEIIANRDKVQNLNLKEEVIVATKLQQLLAFAGSPQSRSFAVADRFLTELRRDLPKHMRFELDRRFRSATIQHTKSSSSRV